MTDLERLSTIQSYAWTLELLGEALVQHDEILECEHNPHLSFRNTAGKASFHKKTVASTCSSPLLESGFAVAAGFS